MSATLSQANRPLQTAVSPLGPDDLVPIRLSGDEGVSMPFSFTVDLASTNPAVAASSVLGKPMSIRLKMSVGKERFFHGIVRRFSSRGRTADFALYRAELVPSLWFLSLATDCRTFEDKTLLEIVEHVVKEHGVVTELSLKVTASLKKIPFVAQYRETNLDFVHRLLEDAGLYYYHRHEKNRHTLVISDAQGGSIPAGVIAETKVSASFGSSGMPEMDSVIDLAREFAVHSASVSLRDHDLLRADSIGSANSSKPGAKGERFDFLGDLGPDDSAGAAKLRIEAEEASHDLVEGTSTCGPFEPGSRVKISGGLLGNSGSELMILRVSHQAEGGDLSGSTGLQAAYRNGFSAMPAATRFRPGRAAPRPSVRGTQVAKIVGSGGAAEIDVDANGCVLLQFPWDRGDGKDGKSKHRVHVASVWAGTGWGFVQLPRIGQEVLVEFLEGDPDRPLITGRVYNSNHKPPYALPANKTQSGMKSRSLGGGTDNFNELRFEDKKGSEQVLLHAEKALDTEVEADETHWVGHDRTTTIDHDETRHVKHNDTVTIDENHTGTVGKNVIVDVGESETITIGKDQTLTIGENRTTDVGKDDVVSIGGNLKSEVGKKITIEAGDEIVFTCGQATLTMKKNGDVTIKGNNITLDAMAKIVAKASAEVQIKGAKVGLNGDAQVEVKGAMVKVEGSAMTTIKGAIAQVTGDGMLKAAGGITMLG